MAVDTTGKEHIYRQGNRSIKFKKKKKKENGDGVDQPVGMIRPFIILVVLLSFVCAVCISAVIVMWKWRADATRPPLAELGLEYPSLHELSLSPSKSSDSIVIVVTDYNTSAGFGWLLWNVLNSFHLCHLAGRNARPVVFFTKGYYHETREKLLPSHVPDYDRCNWFNNYFESMEPLGWRPFLSKHFSDRILAPPAQLRNGTGIFQFTRGSLNALDGHTCDYAGLWKKYLRPLPHIQTKFDALRNKLWGTAKFVYAIHYRGTDKFVHSGTKSLFTGAVIDVSMEDDPSHMPYDWVFRQVREEIKANITNGVHSKKDYRVLVSSDEQPFVDGAVNALGGSDTVVFKPDSIRAHTSTSGLDIDTRLCGVGRGIGTRECAILNTLVDLSVHRGQKHKSSYLKGEDALVETMLLSEADVFFRSRGNFSNLPLLMQRNGSQTVHDMAALWRQSV
jgi:hypothetical protein